MHYTICLLPCLSVDAEVIFQGPLKSKQQVYVSKRRPLLVDSNQFQHMIML